MRHSVSNFLTSWGSLNKTRTEPKAQCTVTNTTNHHPLCSMRCCDIMWRAVPWTAVSKEKSLLSERYSSRSLQRKQTNRRRRWRTRTPSPSMQCRCLTEKEAWEEKRGSLYKSSRAAAVHHLLLLRRGVSPAEEDVRQHRHPAPLQHRHPAPLQHHNGAARAHGYTREPNRSRAAWFQFNTHVQAPV